MSIKSDIARMFDLNFMTPNHIDEARRYLSYVASDYRSGKQVSQWSPSADLGYSVKIFNVVKRALTYLCIDFDFEVKEPGMYSSGYYSMRITFK